MGRQINFYFAGEDEAHFLRHPNLKGVTYLKSDVQRPENKPFDLFHEEPDTTSSASQVYICLKPYLSDVTYREVETRGYYYLKSLDSPVIEFCRSGLNLATNTLVSGRIWYEHKYWDKDDDGNDVLLEKPEELQRLYNSLVRWIRKYCTRLPNGNYIGPHAMEIYKRGSKLSP